jgi:hypothetical protein
MCLAPPDTFRTLFHVHNCQKVSTTITTQIPEIKPGSGAGTTTRGELSESVLFESNGFLIRGSWVRVPQGAHAISVAFSTVTLVMVARWDAVRATWAIYGAQKRTFAHDPETRRNSA